MRHPLKAAVTALALLTVACAGSGDGQDLLGPDKDGLSGTWYYQVTNAYEAVFTGCTGDAAVLEGVTYVHGALVAPVCYVPNAFEVSQTGEAMAVLPESASCGGSAASVTGAGTVADESVTGQLLFESDGAVRASHLFLGSMDGDHLRIVETSRTFEGAFEGACGFTPPLAASVTVR